jgi:hypothetical protein
MANLIGMLAKGTFDTAIDAIGFKIKQEAARTTTGLIKSIPVFGAFLDTSASALGYSR